MPKCTEDFEMVKIEFELFSLVILFAVGSNGFYRQKSFDCGPYGFICESHSKLRLCEGDELFGPSFICPPNSICNEDSNDVCENSFNYIDPSISRNVRCSRNERIADPNVPDCKGYILCIPNKNRFQGIKLRCAGNTIFNGYSRTCSSIDKYKCPLSNNNTNKNLELFNKNNRRSDSYDNDFYSSSGTSGNRPIDCKNYRFSVTPNRGPVKAAYFCPPRPAGGGRTTRCTVFSDQFCITLEKEEEDQFSQNFLPAYRRPRYNL